MKLPNEPGPGADPVALAEFLARLAHDLRSPLGVVTEALASIRSDLDAQLTDEHRLLGNLADRGLGRLGRLASLLSLAAELDSGSFALRCAPVDLVELLRDVTSSAVAIEPRREVTLTCALADGPRMVSADAVRLSRAVSEIVINAIRYAHRKARLRLLFTPGEALISIEDDGQGVSPDQRDALFRRFVRRPSRSGLGLGLSVAHDVIVAHGGRLVLGESTLAPGRPGTTGAELAISLPLA